MAHVWTQKMFKRFNGVQPNVVPSEIRPKAQKAGIFIFGDNEDGELCVVAPWSEGNMNANGFKDYSMPKGTLDPHEEDDPLRGAKREVHEETGIDLDRLARGGYEGVELECWIGQDEHGALCELAAEDPKPALTQISPNHHGEAAEYTLYAVKVKGIEALQGELKNQEANNDNQPTVANGCRVDDQTPEQKEGFPSFEDYRNVLMTGFWPEHTQFRNKEGLDVDQQPGQIFEPHLRFALEHQKMKEQLEATASTLATKGEGLSEEDRQALIEEIGQLLAAINEGDEISHDDSDLIAIHRDSMIHKTLARDLSAVRKLIPYDHHSGLKPDTRMKAGYYQEGADILPVKEYVNRMIQNGNAEPEHGYLKATFARGISQFTPGSVYVGPGRSKADMTLKLCQGVERLLKDNAYDYANEFSFVDQLAERAAASTSFARS